ncbi:hypothetical protein B0O80DRAFT_454158, partial [Mortierella sp. GBAus27b]
MLDIQELDEVICRQLSQHDLAQCAQVNRKWHMVVTPFLWHDLSWIDNFQQDLSSRRAAFCEMVQESYLREKRHDELHGDGKCTEQLLPPSSSAPLSTLAKYGSWIRIMPHPSYLLVTLQSGYDGDLPITESEALDMVRHIYTHCTKIQVEVLSLDTEDLDSDKFLDVLAQFVLPHTRYLHFEGLYGCPVESRKLKYLLDHCSNMLEELSFNIDLQHNDNDMDQEQKDTEPWPVKQLSLQRCGDKSDKSDKSDSTFWRWLWKRCSQVKRLQVTGVGDIIQSLEYGMFVHMLNLNSILLEGQPLPKGGVAAILSSCRNGWKDIRLKREMDVDGLAKEILMEHCRALERLEVEGYPGFESNDIIQMAASSPNLHTLIDVDDNSYWADTQSRLHADAFIDRDPSTGSLRPWACENNLEKLKVRITGIPRPDLEQCTIAFELYPGQGREIQSYVYDRLARLTNLKTLWLGGFGYGPYFYTGYEYTYDWNVSRYDCLEMSLSSGLWKLAGLKALKKLGVASMVTRIGLEEIQWMCNNWPNLRVISGTLDQHEEVAKWLEEHHPKVSLKKL